MQLTTVIVTRNVSVSVKTLHTLLKLNILCIQKNIANEIVFIKDDAFEKHDLLVKKLKHCERILWIEYGLFVDEETLTRLLSPFPKNGNILVAPCVTEGIDWTMFKKKVRDYSTEPKSQMGLNFDTEVSKKIEEHMYEVTKTTPRVWAADSKSILRAFKDKAFPSKPSEFFEKCIQRGLKVQAYTNANLIVTYPHECLGNILETAGVKVG